MHLVKMGTFTKMFSLTANNIIFFFFFFFWGGGGEPPPPPPKPELQIQGRKGNENARRKLGSQMNGRKMLAVVSSRAL